MRFPTTGAAAAVLLLTASAAFPDEEELRRQLDDMRRRMEEMDARHRREIEELRRERSPAAPAALQEQLDRLVDELDELKERPAAQGAAAPVFRLIDVSLNALVTAGASSAREEVVEALQGGGHDPKKRGFTVQNVELVLSGAVDPYLRGQVNLVSFLSPEGETEVELEEAFATTTSLPSRLQVKAGQFFSAFGRHNPQHPHEWDFVDVPVVNGRLLGGDGLRGPGAQVSWLGPDALPVELTAAVQNANGETMASFLSEEPPIGAPVERDVRSFHDTTTTLRAAWSHDLTDEIPAVVGVSGAWGPSGASSGDDARLLGADVSAKWRPLDAHAGFPFVSVRAEWIARRYEFDDAASLAELDDSGWYAQATWGFRRDWTLGLRHDRFDGDVDDVLGLDDRTRWSAALTWHLSEFSKVRLQVNRDRTDALDRDATSVWLQLEFNLGAHGAHRF